MSLQVISYLGQCMSQIHRCSTPPAIKDFGVHGWKYQHDIVAANNATIILLPYVHSDHKI